ncbi:hypothetical protein SEA_WOLLYPOG_57 [Arthrobacter phage Wollypog]|uniref:Uncharacterized protein n=1 Tax=Arthrobacter phage Wollypog TaxID=2790985 RepID=A0A7T3KCL2_9CAUD|nr:hypothetical protein PP291_gp57 [Arthrobacter phage Wollypog]QPX62609.1 hypothetical protein SEA_WOLLYPOG_57 [Arthrobacter phage Wollypog]
MDEVDATFSIDGVPAIEIPTLLDWFDSKIENLKLAREATESPMAKLVLVEQMETIETLKEELLEMTLENMDASLAV